MHKWAQDQYIKRLKRGRCLRPESARSMLHAERYAYAASRPLNVLITIKLPKKSRFGDRPYDIFRKKFWANTQRRWSTLVKDARTHSPFDAIAVFENPATISEQNRWHYGPLHVHWMIRWPFSKCARLNYFLRRTFQREFTVATSSAIRIERVRHSPALARYMAKGIDPPFAKHFHLEHSPQGPIGHRRIIISRSLGPTARECARKAGKDPLPKKRKAYHKKFRPVDLGRLIASVGSEAKARPTRRKLLGQ